LDCVSKPLSQSTEAKIEACLRAIANEELRSKPTTLDADEKQMQQIMPVGNGFSSTLSEAQKLGLEFRIEKKRLLQEAGMMIK